MNRSSIEKTMGHEILPASSPAHRRLQNPTSPISPFRRAAVAREEPDLSWRALLRRHRFLLLMLALLLFLCVIYLYFAITLGTGNSCPGLTGSQLELCKQQLRRGRALLQSSDVITRHLLRTKKKNVAILPDHPRT